MTQQVSLWTSFLIAVTSGLLGSVGAVSGQYLLSRTNQSISRREQQTALLDYRRDAIYAFLEATQELGRQIDARAQGKPWDEDAARSATHQILYRLSCVKLVCTERVANAADDLNLRMHAAAWKKLPDSFNGDIYDYMTELRDPFIAAAAKELYSREIALNISLE